MSTVTQVHAINESAGQSIWYIRHCSLFSCLTMDQMMRADEMSTMRTYRRGETLAVGFHGGADVAIIKDGLVKVQRLLKSGDVATVDVVGKGELVGRLDRLDGGILDTDPDEIVAVDDVVACEFDRSAFITFIHDVPAFSEQLSAAFETRMHRMSERLIDLVFRSAEARLAAFLLRHGEQHGSIRLRTLFVPTGITQAEIGRMVGLSRPTVAEILNDFKRAGLVDLTRKHIVVRDVARLKSLAERVGRE